MNDPAKKTAPVPAHPLAGRSLRIQLNVVAVRAATGEEIAHRHVHGDGGHHH